VIVRFCEKGAPATLWATAALSVIAGFAIFARAPSRERVALEIMGKLGISRSDALATKATARTLAMPASTMIGAAAVAAAGLPLLLWILRRGAVGIWPQAAAFVAYAAIVPWIVQRNDARENARPATKVVTTLIAIPLGLALTAALLHGTHQFFDAGGELARCTGRLDEDTRRLLAAEAAELSRRIASVRASTAVVIMTTAVIPLAEERIYRGLLMNVLVRKYGFRYGLFASAAAFGVAHVGVYEIALYQTVLLGIGFGLAYAEGGLVAAFVVHAVWNLLNLA
jgi:membrane protease YdiL (CAAX protease family)